MDYMSDDEFRSAKKGRRSLERHRKQGADVLLVFFVDTENEESLVDFLYSLLEIYGDKGENIAALILGKRAFARAVCGSLVKEGELVKVSDDKYTRPNLTGLLH